MMKYFGMTNCDWEERLIGFSFDIRHSVFGVRRSIFPEKQLL